ncbi:MAG: DUF2892 domain-containing protein [Pseudomonadota bacterium]
MTCNVGTAERAVRIVLGIALLSLLFILEGNAKYLGLFGLVLLATAAVRWCPVWALFGVNTCGAQKKSAT